MDENNGGTDGYNTGINDYNEEDTSYINDEEGGGGGGGGGEEEEEEDDDNEDGVRDEMPLLPIFSAAHLGSKAALSSFMFLQPC